MKKFNKIIIVGPKSVHIENYLDLIRDLFHEIIFISEEKADYNLIKKNYVVNFRYSSPFKIRKSYKNLKQIIKSENPDFVHVHSINRQAFFTSFITKKFKIPLIATAWGSDVLIVPKRNIFFKKMVTQVLQKADYLTADSQDLIKEINRLSSPKNIKLVFYGINPILEKEKQKIIYSNRLHNPLYNINLIINDFYVFQKSHPDWKLVIGATGSETESLKQQVLDLKLENKIEFVGWLDKKMNNYYYQISSIYFSIPKSDGTSVSLLEAMSAGCVPVVNDIPVSHEWITDGENGIIKSQNETNVLERAFLLNREKVSKINNKIIAEKGTTEIATKEFYNIFKEKSTIKTHKKKVLFLADSNSNHTRKWAKEFIKNDYEIIIFSLYPIMDNWNKINKIKVISYFKDNKVTFNKKMRYLFSKYKLKQIIKEFNPDFTYAHYASSYGLLGSFTKNKKLFVNFLGTDIFGFPNKNFLNKKIIHYVLKKADKIFSSSKIMTTEIKKYTNKSIETIPFGVDTTIYKPEEKKTRNKTIKLGIVKSLSPIYCIDIAINAVNELNKNKKYSFELVICGEGGLQKDLEKISPQNVTFLGKIEQEKVPTFLNSLDIYINSTKFESFGVSTIEAMACGIPVIAFDAGGSAEIITANKNGVLYSPNTPIKLSKAIVDLIDNEEKYNEIKLNATKTIKDLYSLEENTKELMKHF